MGPFPHDAPPAEISKDNPAGTDGFEFVEFAHPEPEKLAGLFRRMGYTPVAKHRSEGVGVTVCGARQRRSLPRPFQVQLAVVRAYQLPPLISEFIQEPGWISL